MIRAFLAIELSPELRAALSAIQQDLTRRLERAVDRHVRIGWVQPASMHLTVKFLGDTPEDTLAALRPAIEQVAAGHPAILVPFARIGAFPRLQQPRVLWAGPLESWEQGREAVRVQALSQAVEAACQAVGLAPEGRPFSPHVSLARIKEGERQVGQALAQSGVLDQPVTMGMLSIKRLVMMKSELRPTGPVYSMLWDCPLASSI